MNNYSSLKKVIERIANAQAKRKSEWESSTEPDHIIDDRDLEVLLACALRVLNLDTEIMESKLEFLRTGLLGEKCEQYTITAESFQFLIDMALDRGQKIKELHEVSVELTRQNNTITLIEELDDTAFDRHMVAAARTAYQEQKEKADKLELELEGLRESKNDLANDVNEFLKSLPDNADSEAEAEFARTNPVQYLEEKLGRLSAFELEF